MDKSKPATLDFCDLYQLLGNFWFRYSRNKVLYVVLTVLATGVGRWFLLWWFKKREKRGVRGIVYGRIR